MKIKKGLGADPGAGYDHHADAYYGVRVDDEYCR